MCADLTCNGRLYHLLVNYKLLDIAQNKLKKGKSYDSVNLSSENIMYAYSHIVNPLCSLFQCIFVHGDT